MRISSGAELSGHFRPKPVSRRIFSFLSVESGIGFNRETRRHRRLGGERSSDRTGHRR